MNLSLTAAINTDSLAIAALRTSVAEHLTRRHGKGHWSSCVTEGSVLRDIKTSRVLAVLISGLKAWEPGPPTSRRDKLKQKVLVMFHRLW